MTTTLMKQPAMSMKTPFFTPEVSWELYMHPRDSGHAVFTPYDLIDKAIQDFLSQCGPNPKNILVQWTPEAWIRLVGHFKIPPSEITVIGDSDMKKQLAKFLGLCYYDINDPQLKTMKFNHVFKNPPWDKGAYAKFWNLAHDELLPGGYQVDILPTNWMTLVSFAEDRKFLLENFEILSIRILDNSRSQLFDVIHGGDVVLMVSQKSQNPNNTSVEYSYFDQPSFTVDLTQHEIWPMYVSGLSVEIWNMVVGKKTKDLDWTDDASKAGLYFVSIPVKLHQRINADFMKNPGTRWELNTLKGTSEIQFLFEDAQRAKLHYEWFRSDIFAYILAMSKSQSKNQPHPIAYTGEHKFINNDFVGHFGLTKQHLDEIARWKLHS
jgi:hypothetical protein